MDAATYRPVDILVSDQEIDHAGCQLGLWQVVDPADDEPVVDERALEGLEDAIEVTVRQPGIADFCQYVFVGQGIKIQKGAIVNRAGFARIAAQLGLDAVQQRRRHADGNRDFLFHQVARYQRTGRTQPAAHVDERHAFEVPRRAMVIDDRVERQLRAEVVPAGVRLAVDHDHGLALALDPGHLLDRQQVDLQKLDHGPVLRPADEAVAGQARRFSQARLNEMSQAQHAAQAVWVRLNMRDEGNASRVGQARQKSIRSAGEGYLAVRH